MSLLLSELRALKLKRRRETKPLEPVLYHPSFSLRLSNGPIELQLFINNAMELSALTFECQRVLLNNKDTLDEFYNFQVALNFYVIYQYILLFL